MSNSLDLVYWPASARMHPLQDHIKAAAAGGFTSVTISPDTFKAAVAGGLTAKTIKRMAADAGVPIRQLDTLTDWNPVRCSPYLTGPLKDRFEVSADESFSICEQLELDHILAFPAFFPGEVYEDAMIEGFANICDRAAAANIFISLEFVPVLGVANLAAAWNIVKTANRPNSGIMIDTWHFSKGNPDFGLLESLPAERLRCIQLADGWKEMRGADLVEDGLFYRTFPGEGDLPVAQTLEILMRKGGLRWVGPETFSKVADQMDPIEAGKRDGEGTRRLLASVAAAA